MQQQAQLSTSQVKTKSAAVNAPNWFFQAARGKEHCERKSDLEVGSILQGISFLFKKKKKKIDERIKSNLKKYY